MNEKQFLERIAELEAMLEDAYVVIDLQEETIKEKTDAIRALKGQLNALRQDRNYVVGIR
jgi:uncharacterized coiled-coil DUF342 family protein